MAFSLAHNPARGSVGLDIDGGFLAAVQVEGGRIERAVSVDLAPGVVSDGEVADGEALTAALKDFFKRAGLPRSVRLGVANQQIVVRQIDLPRIGDAGERDAAVRFQAAEAIAMPLDQAVLDHQLAAETQDAEGGARMQVILVAARRAMIGRLLEAVRGAGLRPEGIDLNAFALVRALGNGSTPDGSARVYCHLAGIANLAIARGSACLFTRPLATHWQGEDPERTASALADEIRLSIDYYMTQRDAQPVEEVVLSGPGGRETALSERLGAALGLPATVADPLGALDGAAMDAGEDPYRHTVAGGLALGDGR